MAKRKMSRLKEHKGEGGHFSMKMPADHTGELSRLHLPPHKGHDGAAHSSHHDHHAGHGGKIHGFGDDVTGSEECYEEGPCENGSGENETHH